MRVLEFVTEGEHLLELVAVPESRVKVDGDRLVILRNDKTFFIVDRNDTLHLSEN